MLKKFAFLFAVGGLIFSGSSVLAGVQPPLIDILKEHFSDMTYDEVDAIAAQKLADGVVDSDGNHATQYLIRPGAPRRITDADGNTTVHDMNWVVYYEA